MKTQDHLNLIRQLAMTSFKPMVGHDYDAFAGAADDALIAFSNSEDLAGAICGLDDGPQTISLEETGGMAVVISGDTVEVHGMDAEFAPFTVTLRVEAQ